MRRASALKPPSPSPGLPKFTVSFGVVLAEPKDDLPAILSRADAALFRAKREGRDRVVVLETLPGEVDGVPGSWDALSLDDGRVLNPRDVLQVADNLNV